MTAAAARWVTAAEAARRLAVSRTTLYAYVSRGHVRSQPSPRSPRERIYASDDIERLRRRTEERRSPEIAAARALEWGVPVLESSISLIDGVRLYYRGVDAEQLARTQTLEAVAALIWNVDAAAAPNPQRRRRWPVRQAPGGGFVLRAYSLLAAAAAADPLAFDQRPVRVARAGHHILQLLTRAAIVTDPRAQPVHAALASKWGADSRAADIMRAALVLCADHELNVSSFTARCVASSGSHPYAVVIAALAALEGPRHGGASARATSMLESLRGARHLRQAITARLRRGETIDGFGPPLYHRGDPRARLLLTMLEERYQASAEYRFVAATADAASAATGELPNIDFALAAVARVLKLPGGSPLMMFAIGRSVGWIGHALEQYATGQLIRPRARYVGVAPTALSGGSE